MRGQFKSREWICRHIECHREQVIKGMKDTNRNKTKVERDSKF